MHALYEVAQATKWPAINQSHLTRLILTGMVICINDAAVLAAILIVHLQS